MQAYDGPIHVADAANYLMYHRKELGIKDPYELNEEQYKAALDLLREQRKLVSRYWHDAFIQMDDFKNEGRGRLRLMAVPGEYPAERKAPGGIDHPAGRCNRLGRYHHAAQRGRASELRLYVDGAYAVVQPAE